MIPFLSTIGLWSSLSFIAFWLCFLLLTRITKGNILKLPENVTIDDIKQGAHLAQLTLYIFISAIILLFAVVLFDNSCVPELFKNTKLANISVAFVDSGLAFAINICFAGYVIKKIFDFFEYLVNCAIKAIAKKTKEELTPVPPSHLTSQVKTWLWISILLIYTVVFSFFKDYTNSFSFLSIIAAYFIWIGTKRDEIRKKVIELLSVSWVYWLVLLTILILIPIGIFYESSYLMTTAAVIGTLLGISLHIYLLFRKNRP